MREASEIAALLADLESDRVERTISTQNATKWGEAICAFANDLPGHGQPGFLIVGANDHGQVDTHQRVTDRLLLSLSNLRSNGQIQPLPAMQVYKVSVQGGEVAVVEVSPSDMPPVRYKGRVCVRIGPSKGYASEQEERMLSERRSALQVTYDVRPVPQAGLSELSKRLFDEYRLSAVAPQVIEANHRPVKEAMAALRFFDLPRDLATVAGILLFGVNPRYHLSGAYVQFLRFPGTSMGDLPADQAEIDGDLRSIVQALHLRISALNTVEARLDTGFRDKLMPTYPEWALRELLHNALIHRDYQSTSPVQCYWFANRVVIHSPGALYGGATLESIRKHNVYRNPVLAEAMKVLGYVNRFGYGFQRVEQLLHQSGNPPMELEATNQAFTATIYTRTS